MGYGVKIVDKVLTRTFYRLGLCIGKNPGYFIIIPVLLTLLFATGYQQINYQIDPEYLFSPIDGTGKYERAVVEEFFKPNYTSRFNVGRITRPGRFGRIIAIPKHGDDMLKVKIWQELRLLDEIIQNATVHFGEETFTYRDICAKWINECFQNDILNLDYIMEDVEKRDLNLTFPLMFNPVTWDAHAFPVYFGGSVVSDEGTILSVPSAQLAYFVTADSKMQDARGAAWEEEFLRVVGEAEAQNRFKYISTARFASRTLDIELERNTRTVVPYFGSTFALMTAFSVITCMMSDWVRSKPYLGLLGCVSAAMACIGAFGLAIYLGFDFIGVNLASPFLMVGVGIDDTFVMLAAWRKTPVTLTVPERMALTLSDAAVSITITSVTDFISFLIGIYSPFRSIQLFCIYSGFAVFLTFLWQITFFSGCMAVAGYCEKKNLHSIVCLPVKPRSLSDKKSIFYRFFCSGGVNPDHPDDPNDNREHCIMAFFRDRIGVWLNNGFVKFFVLVLFAAYLGGACYGVTTIKEGLQRRKLSHASSYSIEFYDREDHYFREFPYRIQVIVSGELNYSDPWTQNEIEKVTQKFENSSFVSNSLYTESWIRSFVNYVHRNGDYLNISIDTEDDFIKNLKSLWLFKPNPFSLDVKFNEDETRIIASRFMIQAVNISDGNMEKHMVEELRRIARESPLNVTAFHPYFVFFDQFELVRPTSISNLVFGALIMMVIIFIFIPDFMCAIWVAFSIVSIECGVVGYMALWDITLDSISMINLIMCVGFSVDFTAHICYSFMSSTKETPKERIQDSLYSLGLPILQGALSTILSVFALILSDSYIFLVFFKMIFMVILFGALHGLFLLPVLLSLVSGNSCFRRSKTSSSDWDKKDRSQSPIEKALPYPYCIPHPSLVGGMNNNWEFAEKKRSAYLPSLPSHMNLTTYERSSPGFEKDLGLGTSGEDSSETHSDEGRRRRERRNSRHDAYYPRELNVQRELPRANHRNRKTSTQQHYNYSYTPDF